MGTSSIGKPHSTCRGGIQTQRVLMCAQCRSRRNCQNCMISNWKRFVNKPGGQFCRFGGAPLRPPGSTPPSANRAKRFGRKLDTTVDLRIFGSVGSEGGCISKGHSCTISLNSACWFWARPPSNTPGRRQSCSDEHLHHGTLGAGVRSTPVSLA